MASVQVNGTLRARDHESITTLTSSTGLTSTKYVKESTANDPFSRIRHAVEVVITVEVADIRWTIDGTVPTVSAGTGLGHIASLGDDITITGHDNIKNFRAINAVAANGAALRITYFFA